MSWLCNGLEGMLIRMKSVSYISFCAINSYQCLIVWFCLMLYRKCQNLCTCQRLSKDCVTLVNFHCLSKLHVQDQMEAFMYSFVCLYSFISQGTTNTEYWFLIRPLHTYIKHTWYTWKSDPYMYLKHTWYTL